MEQYYQEDNLLTDTKNGERWAQKTIITIINYCMKRWEVMNNFFTEEIPEKVEYKDKSTYKEK